MRTIVLTTILTICMVTGAQAAATFSFDSLPEWTNAAAIESYMEGIYGSDITVANAFIGKAGLLGPDTYMVDASFTGTGSNWFTISFNAVPITSMSFDWERFSDNFYAVADGTTVFSRTGAGSASGVSGLISFAGPVTTLYFHDSGTGYVAIDNLTVTPIPAPGAILLGSIGVALVGWMRRRKTI